jgi:LysR family transcriptional regulator (chromosome initiation inhibitor)
VRYVAVASPDFVQRYFPAGVTAAALAEAPSLNFDRKDRLQARWIRRVCRRNVDVPVHWLPSIQAFVDAGVAGIGWGVNPLLLVRSQLHDGTLVELVPERAMTVPLFWQHTRLQIPMLARLTRAVVSTARGALRRA